MNKYRYLHDSIEVLTTVNRVKTALMDFGAILTDTKLQRSQVFKPTVSKNTSTIAYNGPRSVAAVVSTYHIGLEKLDALKRILNDLGVELELARD